MPQLLLEFFSEEMPARMQKRAEEDLARALTQKLEAAGLKAESVSTFSSARHLGVVAEGLAAKAEDVNEERKGPRVGAPDQAVQGFLKSAGLARIEDAEIVEDKKGSFYVARIARAGRATAEILQDAVPEIVRAFPWPKSMRSGQSDLTWVRPLHNVLCLFDGAAVKIDIEGVGNEAVTWGHRFHAPDAIGVKDAGDHYATLRAAKVLIDREERKAIILEQAQRLCAERKLELVEDAGLLEEVTGLVEWPVVLMGRMDEAFLDLAAEVIRLSMRTHQKYFAVRDPKNGKLAPNFIVVANIAAKDGGDSIAAGNARVLSARLNDARFFWNTDLKTPLRTQAREDKLKKLVFHQKLGSVWDKVERVKALAKELAPVVWASPLTPPPTPSPSRGGGIETLEQFIAAVEAAALLSKMDLVTETVGEFPELQGQVGRELYLAQFKAPASTSSARRLPEPVEGGASESIAAAIEDHYRPLGPNDRVPTDKVAVTLALADKLDTLVGFWAIGEKPTGSSDAYGLRRAALGLVRIILTAQIRLDLGFAHIEEANYGKGGDAIGVQWHAETFGGAIAQALTKHEERSAGGQIPINILIRGRELIVELLAFLADRLKVQLREQGKRHDLVDAVFALGDDDLVRIVARVEALDAFLKTEDGANLLAGYKRAANIISAEEKKGRLKQDELAGGVDSALLQEPAEKALGAALDKAAPQARASVEAEDFTAAMQALSALRAPVDAFFDKVMVNADDPALRLNRLRLLAGFSAALGAVADFSRIES